MSEASQAPTERFRVESILVVVLVYFFLVSIKLLAAGFEALGGDFTNLLQNTVRSPFVGLAMGVLVTSVVQSSSVTIATVIAMVGSGQLPVQMAVPMIMGANIGTTITNTLVSMAHVPHRPEFRRAVTTATLRTYYLVEQSDALWLYIRTPPESYSNQWDSGSEGVPAFDGAFFGIPLTVEFLEGNELSGELGSGDWATAIAEIQTFYDNLATAEDPVVVQIYDPSVTS